MNRPPIQDHAGARHRSQYYKFLALALASVALWWQPLRTTLKLALNSDAYTYILLILPVSLALVYIERKEVASSPSSRRWLGWILLGAAFFVRCFIGWKQDLSSASTNLLVSMFALVVFWLGSVVVCFGVGLLRAHAFAFSFLFLLIPLPTVAVNWVTEALQHGSAVSAEVLFRIAQVPVTRHDVVLSIPDLDIEVAGECSSIRSSTLLIVITLLFAHLFLRSNWRKVLLVVVAVPLCVAKNAVRVFTIAELATRVDPSYLTGKLHHNGGVVFLGLAVLLTLLLLWVLRKTELRTAP